MCSHKSIKTRIKHRSNYNFHFTPHDPTSLYIFCFFFFFFSSFGLIGVTRSALPSALTFFFVFFFLFFVLRPDWGAPLGTAFGTHYFFAVSRLYSRTPVPPYPRTPVPPYSRTPVLLCFRTLPGFSLASHWLLSDLSMASPWLLLCIPPTSPWFHPGSYLVSPWPLPGLAWPGLA